MQRAARVTGLAFGLVVVGFVSFLIAAQTGFLPVTAGEYDERTLRVTDCDGNETARVEAGVAESFGQRYVGLSRTASLGTNEGLLFPYDEAESHRIEMRNMDFPLDIVYVSGDGRITEIATLPAPEGAIEYYLTYASTSGTGQYVLEVNAGWAETNGVTAGDCVRNLP